MVKKNIKVLIVDDSRIVSGLLADLIESDPELTVMGIAGDPYEAVRLIQLETPDVILLDIEMPKMDGITFLKKIMSQHPLPVVIFSSVAEKNSKNALHALRYGALDVIPKPKNIDPNAMEQTRWHILLSLKAAAISKYRLHLLKTPGAGTEKINLKHTVNVLKETPNESFRKIVLIGASTGGTQAIEFILEHLTPPVPPILITQHMPGGFTHSFAERLNTISSLQVHEAENAMTLKTNHVYVANGFYHLQLVKSGERYRVRLGEGEAVNRHKPSVDVLFHSAAQYAGDKAVGILLTGMGDDGARSLLEMKNAGAVTIAQDEKSAVVWGMPRKAVQLGAAAKVLSLIEISNYLNGLKY